MLRIVPANGEKDPARHGLHDEAPEKNDQMRDESTPTSCNLRAHQNVYIPVCIQFYNSRIKRPLNLLFSLNVQTCKARIRPGCARQTWFHVWATCKGICISWILQGQRHDLFVHSIFWKYVCTSRCQRVTTSNIFSFQINVVKKEKSTAWFAKINNALHIV